MHDKSKSLAGIKQFQVTESQSRPLWGELRSFSWASFSWGTFFQAVIFGLLTSGFDIFTDFNFAATTPDICTNETVQTSPCCTLIPSEVQSLTYSFIAVPGIMLAYNGMHSILSQRAKAASIKCLKHQSVGHLLINAMLCLEVLCLFASLIGIYIISSKILPSLSYVLAIITCTFILGVKLLAVIFHGPQMKNFSLAVASAESRFESAFQLFFVLYLSIDTGVLTTSSILSSLGAMLMIGKAGSETYVCQKMKEDPSFCSKFLLDLCSYMSPIPKRLKIGSLKCLKKPLVENLLVTIFYALVFALCGAFKIGAQAVITSWNQSNRNKNIPTTVTFYCFVLVLPLIFLFLLKSCGRLRDLTARDICQGVWSELFTVTIWEDKSQKGGQITRMLSHYYLLVYSTYLVMIVWKPQLYPTSDYWFFCNWRHENDTELIHDYNKRVQRAAATLIPCGWSSFLLFRYLFVREEGRGQKREEARTNHMVQTLAYKAVEQNECRQI